MNSPERVTRWIPLAVVVLGIAAAGWYIWTQRTRDDPHLPAIGREDAAASVAKDYIAAAEVNDAAAACRLLAPPAVRAHRCAESPRFPDGVTTHLDGELTVAHSSGDSIGMFLASSPSYLLLDASRDDDGRWRISAAYVGAYADFGDE